MYCVAKIKLLWFNTIKLSFLSIFYCIIFISDFDFDRNNIFLYIYAFVITDVKGRVVVIL